MCLLPNYGGLHLTSVLQLFSLGRLTNHLGKVKSNLDGGIDWVTWKNNTPSESYTGGVWEQQIKSACMILPALLKQHSLSLNNKTLITLLTEVESIVNLTPLIVKTLSDIGSEVPLNPISILTMKSNVVLQPPGEFKQADLYSQGCWGEIQHITKEF